LAASYPVGRRASRMRTAALVGCLAVLVSTPILINVSYSQNVAERALSGKSGKVRAVGAVESELTTNVSELFFGAGPGETVSHSALLTTVAAQDPESPVATLDLEPSETIEELGGGEGSSVADPPSSAVGILGDLGLVGALTYLALLGFLIISAWRLRTPSGAGAVAALALFVILGFAFTWWEQTGFSLYVALFVGLALASGRHK
jgi:hypothetical protein